MRRMSQGQEAVQMRWPVQAQFLIGQFLSRLRISQLEEAVISSEVSQFALVHLACQHGPAVEADVHREGIPTLNPNVAPPEARILKIMVKVQALSVLVNWLQTLALMIGADGHDRAGFDGTQHADQSIFDAILLGYPLGPLLFIEVRGTAAYVVVRPLLVCGSLASQIAHLVANLLSVLGKILE